MLKMPADFAERLVNEISLLKKFARKFTTDQEDLNDLVQDTILKAMTCFEKFQEGTNFKGWLFVLMRNIYINNFRRLNLYLQFAETLSVQFNFSVNPYHSNGGEERLTNNDIKYALNSLKPIFHVPFARFMEGYQYHEIASELNVPIGTIKTRIHVARTTLKDLLKAYKQKI